MNEKISVIIPAKNRKPHLKRALDSVNKQTCKDLEVILVDDGSTDGTENFIKTLYPNIIYVKNSSSMGGAVSRNRGAKLATGEYIAFLDSDDEWLPSHLENKLKILTDEGSDGVFGNFTLGTGKSSFKDPNLVPWDSGTPVIEYILGEKRGDARTSTFFLKKDSFLSICFDEKLQKHQDWDFAIRFSERFRWSFDSQKTVILHVDTCNRMSKSNHQVSTLWFADKNFRNLPERLKSRFFFKRALQELENGSSFSEIKPLLERYQSFSVNNRFYSFIVLLIKMRFPVGKAVRLFRKLKSRLN